MCGRTYLSRAARHTLYSACPSYPAPLRYSAVLIPYPLTPFHPALFHSPAALRTAPVAFAAVRQMSLSRDDASSRVLAILKDFKAIEDPSKVRRSRQRARGNAYTPHHHPLAVASGPHQRSHPSVRLFTHAARRPFPPSR